MLRSQEKQPKKRLASTMMNVPFASTKNLGHPSFCRVLTSSVVRVCKTGFRRLRKNRNKTCRAPCVKNSTIWRASPLVRFWQNKAGFLSFAKFALLADAKSLRWILPLIISLSAIASEAELDADTKKMINMLMYSATLRTVITTSDNHNNPELGARIWSRSQGTFMAAWSQTPLENFLLGELWEPTKLELEAYLCKPNEAKLNSKIWLDSLFLKIKTKADSIRHRSRPFMGEYQKAMHRLANQLNQDFQLIVVTQQWPNLPLSQTALELMLQMEVLVRHSFNQPGLSVVLSDLRLGNGKLIFQINRDAQKNTPLILHLHRRRAIMNIFRKLYHEEIREAFIRFIPFVDIEL